MKWLRSREVAPLVGLVLVALAVWAFIVIASEVTEGDTVAFDRTILLALRNPTDVNQPFVPPWLQEMARDLTALGGVALLAHFTLAVILYLTLAKKYRVMVFVLVAVGGGMLLRPVLKDAFARPRPDLVPHGSIVSTTSFPSGHSMLSAVAYLTFGALLARLQTLRRIKVFLLSFAVLVGISRVYLSVHWPTDVLAGWAVGAAWAMLCWLVALRLQRHGQIEHTLKPPDDLANAHPIA